MQEARQLLASGQFEAAEAKARQAQKMNVVPSLTTDRAETVLHDLAMVKARNASPSAPAGGMGVGVGDPNVAVASATPAAGGETASFAAEREANELSQAADNLRKKLEERNALVSPVVEHNQHSDDQTPNSKNPTPDSAESAGKEPSTKAESK